VNGAFPILVCAGRGMWWAVILGSIAMGIPLTLALNAPHRASAREQRVRGAPFRVAAD
jgi:hypothetical protein